MHRIASVVILACALLLSSFTLTSASADSKHRDDSHGFRLVAVTAQSAQIDVGPKGDSIGDYYVFSDNLSWKGRAVGTQEGQCTVTRIDTATGTFHQQCLVTAVLPKGQLTVQGAIVMREGSEQDRFTVAITGGTGRYAGAGGQATVRFINDTTAVIKVYLR